MRSKLVGPAALLMFVAWGCADAQMGKDPDNRWGEPSTTTVTESINYQEASAPAPGPTPIGELLEITDPGASGPGERNPVWFGFAPGDPYPMGQTSGHGEACDSGFGNKPYKLDELPVTIEGVVTLHPQHYEKVGLCGEDHRFYGTYYLQDETGSILILKDSRIADFTFGDRVRLRVRGVAKQFGTMAVMTFDKEEVVNEDHLEVGAQPAVPYEKLDVSFAERFNRDGKSWGPNGANCWQQPTDGPAGFDVPDGMFGNYRVTGRVCQEPTSANFNEIVLQKRTDKCVDDPEVLWTASMGLELGRRGVGIEKGDIVTATGPVSGLLIGLVPCNWTFRMAIGSRGQLKIHDQ